MSSELATQTQPIDPWKAVSAEEFRLRQDAARAACSAAGLDGLVVYSRGGACVDMYADVLYLSNHYSQQPAMGDHAGIGTARAHGVLVLPVDGPCIAVVDVPWWRPDLVVADDVRMSTDVTDAVAGAIRDTGLDTKRWALVGSSSMNAAAYRGLVSAHRRATGARNFTNCDSLLIGHHCGAHTVPYIEAKNSSAVFEHEATTSKISEDMLFYCRQRGLSADDATALVVNGFVKDVLQHLPMEFAVEAQTHFDQPGGKRGLNVIRRPEMLAQRASKDGGPEIARHPSRLWLRPRTSG